MKKNQVPMKRLPQEQIDNSKVIVLANNKGGCGKTTTAIALGVYAARSGKNVLFIDADPQSNLTQRLGLPDGECQDHRFGRIFSSAHVANDTTYRRLPLIVRYPYLYRINPDVVKKTGSIGLIPGDRYAEGDAKTAEEKVGSNKFIDINNRSLLQYYRNCLNFYRGYFDYVIVDSAPALEGNILNILSTQTADEIIAPIDGLEAASGVQNLLAWFWKETMGKGLTKPNVLFAMTKYHEDPVSYTGFDLPANLKNSVYDAMKTTFGDYVCFHGVKESRKLRRKVAMFGESTDYMALCEEIMDKISTERPSIFEYATDAVFGKLEKRIRVIREKARDEKVPKFRIPHFNT